MKDFALPVENTCLAAGYTTSYSAPLLQEEFDSGTTPEGWTVVNRTANGGWAFTDPRNRGNLTGGTGRYAIIDSDNAGSGRPGDTDLVSPPLDLSSVAAPVLRFNSDYRAWSNGSADVDISVDGGTTWTNLSRWTTEDRRGPRLEEIPLTPAGGKSDVRVRFHYQANWGYWWEVDNVSIVNRSTTAASADDAKVGDGFYSMFSTLTGEHPFSPASAHYESATSAVNVAASQATRADFTLRPAG